MTNWQVGVGQQHQGHADYASRWPDLLTFTPPGNCSGLFMKQRAAQWAVLASGLAAAALLASGAAGDAIVDGTPEVAKAAAAPVTGRCACLRLWHASNCAALAGSQAASSCVGLAAQGRRGELTKAHFPAPPLPRRVGLHLHVSGLSRGREPVGWGFSGRNSSGFFALSVKSHRRAASLCPFAPPNSQPHPPATPHPTPPHPTHPHAACWPAAARRCSSPSCCPATAGTSCSSRMTATSCFCAMGGQYGPAPLRPPMQPQAALCWCSGRPASWWGCSRAAPPPSGPPAQLGWAWGPTPWLSRTTAGWPCTTLEASRSGPPPLLSPLPNPCSRGERLRRCVRLRS